MRVRGRCMLWLADFLQNMGRQGEAVALLRNVLDILPNDARAYWGLVSADRELNATSDCAESLTELATCASLSLEQRLPLHLRLGELYDRSHRAPEAFAHFKIANELRRAPPEVDIHFTI